MLDVMFAEEFKVWMNAFPGGVGLKLDLKDFECLPLCLEMMGGMLGEGKGEEKGEGGEGEGEGGEEGGGRGREFEESYFSLD